MKTLKNVAASVYQRLLNLARQSGRPFNELAQYYALERWLYRLAQSDYRNQFVLKGALMLLVKLLNGQLYKPNQNPLEERTARPWTVEDFF